MANVIVAASGGFDPLHIGHIEYLKRAKELGTKLVVIVNTDDFLIRKKGYALMPCDERMRIVATLRCVDEVVRCIDEDDTVCQTLRKIRPHIFAKGGDRLLSRHNIPEAATCREIGCVIVDGLGEKVQSSTKMIERIQLVHPGSQLVDKSLGCPACGERRKTRLMGCSDMIICLTCSHEYKA